MRPEDKIWLNSQIKNMVNKKYTQEMTPAERVKGGASALPVVGDAISGYDAYQSAKQGDYLGAALNAVGLLPLIPGLAGVTKYVRRSQDVNTPFSEGIPYAMFLEAGDNAGSTLEKLSSYGKGKWITTDKNAVDVKDIQKDILKEIRKQGINLEYGSTAAALTRESNPQNILDSAGLWDNPNIITAIYDNVLGNKGISAVKTSNGLIKFDSDGIKKIGK